MKKPLAVLLAAAVLVAGAVPSHATLKIQKAAKKEGFPAENCLYCHNEKMPVKGKVTHNERGTYLVHQKETRKPKEVDVVWLKDFVAAKK
jgi:5-formaminoimidazole-4-carboxamide-1-beta-D-ribofuranosyl 5'-monophosphate synthetase